MAGEPLVKDSGKLLIKDSVISDENLCGFRGKKATDCEIIYIPWITVMFGNPDSDLSKTFDEIRNEIFKSFSSLVKVSEVLDDLANSYFRWLNDEYRKAPNTKNVKRYFNPMIFTGSEEEYHGMKERIENNRLEEENLK